MPRASSLPGDLPRLLGRRPHLAVALLRWRNAYRFRRRRLLSMTALAVALAILLVAAPPTGSVLRWLASNPPLTFAVSACLFGLAAARRHARIQVEAATSWLSALPVPRSAVLRMVSSTLTGLLAVSSIVTLARASGRIATPTAWTLVLVTAAAAVAGALAGWRLQGRAAKGSAGWQYATVRRARRRWATSPSVSPLGYWPVAQGRIFSRPRTTSLVVLMALLSIPSGRHDPPGQVVIAVAAGTMTVFALLTLFVAAVRVAGDAARWLAPTTIRLRAFVAAFVWQVALKEAAVLAVVVLLASALDYPRALRVGSALAVGYVVISCAAASAACVWACRQVGLGTARRGR